MNPAFGAWDAVDEVPDHRGTRRPLREVDASVCVALPPGDWIERAECTKWWAAASPEEFAEPGSGARRRGRLLATCDECIVRRECLLHTLSCEHSLPTPSREAPFAGGYTFAQRTRIRRAAMRDEPRAIERFLDGEEREDSILFDVMWTLRSQRRRLAAVHAPAREIAA